MILFPASILSLLLLSGCAASHYEMPAQGILTQSQMEEQYEIDREWWKQYGDPTLDALVEKALERNLDLARSAISVNKALYQARQLGADLVPRFSSSGDAGTKTFVDSGDTSRSFSASFGLTYELDLWGRVRDAASAQVWAYEATASDLDAARLALVNSVVNTYYSMAYTKQAIAIGREDLSFYERLYRIVDEKFKAGKTDGLDPAQAEQSLLAQRSSLLSLEDRLADEQKMLRELLALRPDEELPSAETDLLSVDIPAVDLEVPVSALGARPDVQAAEARIQSAFSSHMASRKALYPSLTVGGTLAAASSSAGTMFSDPYASGILTLRLPFLDWNRVRWDVKISESQFEDSKLAFQKSLVTALNEVDRYRQSLGIASQLFENTKQEHAADLRVQEYRKARYELGADELRNWLEALRSSNSSRLGMLEAKFQMISSTNAIWQAMGGRITGR